MSRRAPRVEGRYPQAAYCFYVEDADALRGVVLYWWMDF